MSRIACITWISDRGVTGSDDRPARLGLTHGNWRKGKKDAPVPGVRLKTCEPVFEIMATNGVGLVKACALHGKHPSEKTVRVWIDADPELATAYARTREARADFLHDEILRIADTPLQGHIVVERRSGPNHGTNVKTGDMLKHRKLQVATLKWLVERMDPKRFGKRTCRFWRV